MSGAKDLVWAPGAEYLSTPPMPLEARRRAGYLLRMVQDGHSIGMPESRPMPRIGARPMDTAKRKRLEEAGFTFGTVGELFQLDEADEEIIEMKVALAASVRKLRDKKGISQAELARQLASGQARVSKIERADSSVSLDLMVRAALVLGATRAEVARAMTVPLSTPSRARRPSRRARRAASPSRAGSAT